ncbi:MAG: UDP-N-acetylmuramate--alanine ligase, partial [Rickettsiales bacterium]
MSFHDLAKKYSSGKIHFIGIGGIGMSAIALILSRIGCNIQGSDLTQNNNTKTIEALGIECFVGHKTENLTDDVVLVVETSIVKPTNPEILQAKSRNIPIFRRADILKEIISEKKGITISGTHGKTSTTAMVSVLLESAGLDPVIINGGIINYFGSNAKFGEGEFLVAEADESDASFVDLPSFIGVVNNIEPEHMDFYNNDFELVKKYYQKYLEQIPANGLAAVCIDDDEVFNLYKKLSQTQDNLVSLSIKNKDADYFGFNISFDQSGLKFDVKIKKTGQIISDIKMSAYGVHNIKNALAPVAIGVFLGLSSEKIKKGLADFTGVKRRFSKTGEVNG